MLNRLRRLALACDSNFSVENEVSDPTAETADEKNGGEAGRSRLFKYCVRYYGDRGRNISQNSPRVLIYGLIYGMKSAKAKANLYVGNFSYLCRSSSFVFHLVVMEEVNHVLFDIPAFVIAATARLAS